MAKYQILSLDGGGAWALIQVRALAAFYGEAAKGHDILADFDLVAANSGGSIVAAGLAEDLSLAQILDYFKDKAKRRAIFAALPFYRKISPGARPRPALLRGGEAGRSARGDADGRPPRHGGPAGYAAPPRAQADAFPAGRLRL